MMIRKYNNDDLPEMINIWNEVVGDGIAFPQEEYLDIENGAAFFASQNYTWVQRLSERYWDYIFCTPIT